MAHKKGTRRKKLKKVISSLLHSNLKKVKTLRSNIPMFNPPDDYVIPDSSKAIFIRGRNGE